MTFLPYILFLIGFPLRIKGADFLVDGASSLARRFHVSDLVIGLTVVAFGTSSPELFVNVISSLKGNTDIAIANVLGSNIANIFLILGVSSVIKPMPYNPRNNLDISVGVLASLLLFLCMFTGRRRSLDRWEGMIFLGLYVCYMVVVAMMG